MYNHRSLRLRSRIVTSTDFLTCKKRKDEKMGSVSTLERRNGYKHKCFKSYELILVTSRCYYCSSEENSDEINYPRNAPKILDVVTIVENPLTCTFWWIQNILNDLCVIVFVFSRLGSNYRKAVVSLIYFCTHSKTLLSFLFFLFCDLTQ